MMMLSPLARGALPVRSRSVSGIISRCSLASSDAVTRRVPESRGPVRGHRYAAGCEGPKAQSVPTKKAARTARRPKNSGKSCTYIFCHEPSILLPGARGQRMLRFGNDHSTHFLRPRQWWTTRRASKRERTYLVLWRHEVVRPPLTMWRHQVSRTVGVRPVRIDPAALPTGGAFRHRLAANALAVSRSRFAERGAEYCGPWRFAPSARPETAKQK
jgi:hypothetical protein